MHQHPKTAIRVISRITRQQRILIILAPVFLHYAPLVIPLHLVGNLPPSTIPLSLLRLVMHLRHVPIVIKEIIRQLPGIVIPAIQRIITPAPIQITRP
jgi:hypothetical protein